MKFVCATPIFWLAKKMSDFLNQSKTDGNESKAEAKEVAEDPRNSYLNSDTLSRFDEQEKIQTEEFIDFNEWCKQLIRLVDELDFETYMAHSKRGEYINIQHATSSTIELSEYVFKTLGQLAAHINDNIGSAGTSKRVKLAATKHTVFDLSDKNNKNDLVSEFRITSSTRSLLIHTKPGRLHAYLLPAKLNFGGNCLSTKYEISSEIEQAVPINNMVSRDHETNERLKLSIILNTTLKEDCWMVNGLPVTKQEIIYLSKALLRDLVILSCLDNLAYQSGKKFELVDNIHRVGITRGNKDSLTLTTEISQDLVQDLVFAQQNTVQKLLRQQEEIQASIARDLHDTVLADIMLLLRRTSSDGALKKDDLVDTLEEISFTIREICQGLVPRDLKDWGLETVLEDLVDKTAERLEADCSFQVDGELPDLPSAVQLHIFRIVQESLNNIEKYAEAKNVKVFLKAEAGILTVQVEDDGIGFDVNKPRDQATKGGFGLPSINERLEIIRAYYPSKLKFESEENKGTTITIEITVDTFE